MTDYLMEQNLKDAYIHAVSLMKARLPEKLRSEVESLWIFGFESFRVGFLYGMGAGLGAADVINEERTQDHE